MNSLLNECISKILSDGIDKNEIKIHIQNVQDFNLLLKLNNDLLNITSCSKVTFYYNVNDKNINDLINFCKKENIHICESNDSNYDFIFADFVFSDGDSKILKCDELFDLDFSKLLLTFSSEFFNENIGILGNLKDSNNLESIISLPLNKDEENLILICINSHKQHDKFILIDESDSLIHKNTKDQSFISEDLTNNIVNSYKNLSEYENSVLLPVSNIIQKKSVFGHEFGRYIEIDEDSQHTKKRVIANQVVDDILNEKNIINENSIEIPYFSFKEFFYGKKIQDMNTLNIKNNKKIIDEDIKIKKLGELVNLRNINKKNQKERLLIATCKDCTSKIAFNNFDVEEFKDGEIYIEVNVISKEIMTEYLLVYLNSTNGLNEIFYFSKGNKYITPEKIKDVRVPVPSKKVQKEIVKAVQETNKFFKEIDLLRKSFDSNILDYKSILESIDEFKGDMQVDADTGLVINMSRNWQHVYNGLIWPLAISYLQVTSGRYQGVGKLRNYLRLFEFVVAFNFIVLLSGLPDDVYDRYKFEIWDYNPLKFYREMTFGKWVILTKNISKIYKNNNFPSELDEELLEKITQEKILKIYEMTLECRNEDDSHGPMMVDEEAEEIVEELDKYLEDIFDILDIYSNYQLIYTTDDVKLRQDKYDYKVILLNGPYPQPVYEHFIFDERLNVESLYLFNPKNNKRLLIKDNLMKFCAIDKYKKHWGLFLYSGCDKDENLASYQCFQSREKDIEVPIHSLKDSIIS